jgi:hypothetical protein
MKMDQIVACLLAKINVMQKRMEANLEWMETIRKKMDSNREKVEACYREMEEKMDGG